MNALAFNLNLPKHILVVLAILLQTLFVSSTYAQNFADKSHFLVDSLVLKDLSNFDKHLLDSCLTIFHNAKHDTTRIKALTGIVEGSWDDNVWPKYNMYTYHFIRKSLTKKHALKTKRYLLSALAGAINNIGYHLKTKGEIDKALKYYHESLDIKEKLGDKRGIAVGINNIAVLLEDQGEMEKALEYYDKCLVLQKEIKDSAGIARSYSNIGLVHYNQLDMEKAIRYCHKARKIQEKINDKKGLGTSLNNLAAIYSKQGNYELSLEFHLKSLAMEEEIGNLQGVAWSANNVAGSYASMNKPELAIPYVQKSLDLGKKLGVPVLIQNAAISYSRILALQNKGMEALEMYKLYISTRDSLNDVETQKNTAKQLLQYEFEKQKAVNDAEHEKQLALEQEEKEKQQLITIATIIGLLLLAVFSVIIYKRLKITNKQKIIIEEQKSEIVDSITYAKRIQEAILPEDQFLDACFSNYFIYYQPKDIVAGDFYWAQKKNDQVIFAVADCTGHGVPGAMMSVICNNALDRATREYKLTKPSEILDKTQEIVVEQLNKSEVTKSVLSIKDGMDICLCSLDTKTGNIAYAGAYNPLWILRQGNDEMEVLKANRQPIGRSDRSKPFVNHETKLNKGDIIYLFTDGYADQFGGDKGKKLMSKNFRALLISNASKSMKDQKENLFTQFNAWKRDMEQIDDVCVMGVKF